MAEKPVNPGFLLSKSTFLMGMQCEKLLYLNRFAPHLKTPPDKHTLRLFDMGKAFEQKYKSQFSRAVDMKELLKNRFSLYPAETRMAIDAFREVVIFEAGLLFKEVLVLTDVLIKNMDGSFSVYEIKLNPELTQAIWWDLSIQYYVCKNSLPNIRSFNLVSPDSEGGFSVVNYQSELENQIPFTEERIERFKSVFDLSAPPQVEMGLRCERPYKCGFSNYCRSAKAQ